ncbi:MAG: tRNA uridine-5-carboxymethylaminomethyl(34) synthesis GTPase MnmE [Candidatus Omnitrophica bacterium]|nr:tRNA uridine-5-carboxymethylaminomethyl(34) synthesis GTPase MnmE [Candidatus Omnitrophota bacterium]MDD5652574.1 tRNA uridine-5-carboxymethylaminomethyl(34) synthesis GTPase MnmE [Candidatus Omnitrophota bacterium]
MFKNDLQDTIAATATAIGESGIGIVRLSGKNALKIADKIFFSKDSAKPSDFKTYTLHYGLIVGQNKEIIDEVILSIMRSPKSYTKEDVVEINCHGGVVAMRAVLDLALANGARLAQPGEFTKRAFLNGRIDLSQAEAVLDIIRAKTDTALKIGLEQLKGGLSREIAVLRKELLDILVILEANIDFPEEEINAADLKKISLQLKAAEERLSTLLKSVKTGKILREGVHVVICGKPNAGKSSLLNALLKQERSIVTAVAGTTRDTIEEIVDIKGVPIRIVDTAGIIEPRDLVEKKAVQRTKAQVDLADLVIILFDGSKKLNQGDFALMRRLKSKTTLAVVNKIDLKQKIEREKLKSNFTHLIEISCRKAKNINLLEEEIVSLVYKGKVAAQGPVFLSNLRHAQLLRKTEKLVAESRHSLDNKLPLEFIAQGIKDALLHLDDILGKNYSQDLLDKIFSEFCIGK